jgi:hypothetical protein
MEQHAFKNVNNCLNTNICSYLETIGDQSSNLYLNVVNFFNTSFNQTSVTVVLLHWCLIHVVLSGLVFSKTFSTFKNVTLTPL